MQNFFEQHQRECVIVRLKREDKDGDCSAIRDILDNFQNDLFWMNAEILTLGEARGRIVILHFFHRQPAACVQHLPLGIPYGALNIKDQFAQRDVLARFLLTSAHL